MLNPSLTRRRLIVIAATAAGSAFVTGGRTAQAGDPVRWYGSALGAQVSIEIYHPDRVEAKRLVAQCVLDVQRLEQQFSLYRADSAICALNRTGILVSPDADMVALLKASLFFSDLTDCAFDPTVQPLWQLYADHFSSERPDSEGPSPQRLAETLAKVGRSRLLVSEDRVALVERGASITLNGIAQGFATNVFTLKDGSVNLGFVTSESGDKVTIRTIAAQEFTYQKADIVKRDTLPTSLMPPGLLNNLTVKEFASLLDYLEGLSKK